MFGTLPFNLTRKTRLHGVFYVSGCALLVPPSPNAKDTPQWACFWCSALFPSTRHVNTPCRRVLRVCYCPLRPSSAERERYALVGVSLVFGALFLHPDT